MSFQVFGIAVTRGVAIGRAVLIASGRVDVAHYFVEPDRVDSEVRRCLAACEHVANELQALRDALPEDAPPELDALLDVHLMLARDPAFTGGACQWIEERRYNAEWALSAQLEALGRQFDDMEDDYLRERKSDLEQLVGRIQEALALQSGAYKPIQHPAARASDFGGDAPLLLVAGDVSPADMMGFREGIFQGFITDTGGRTSHTAIVARSLGVPAVVGTREASRLIRQDDWLIIDADQGVVIVDPSPIVLDEYRFRQRQSELERARLDRLHDKPAVTLDGQHINMLANIELPEDVQAAIAAGAKGVGLMRTEFLFMNKAGQLPSEEEQYLAYRQAVEALAGLPLTIRTIDIGADKPLDRSHGAEARHDTTLNPALGLRAIRWSLSEPSMFRQQLRAIVRAAQHGPVRLLVPMIGNRAELLQVHEHLRQAYAQLGLVAASGPQPMQVGIMIEVPAAALCIDSLLPLVDFVSIGTNDLIQYTLAIDRADQAVSYLYDPWHPAVLRLLADVIRKGAAAGKDVSVCGEMAGDASFTSLLLGLGLRSFSMQAAQLNEVKQAVLRTDCAKVALVANQVIQADTPQAKAQAHKLTR